MHTFYNTEEISLNDKINIISDAFSVQEKWWVDKLDCNLGFSRILVEISFEDIMKKFTNNCHFSIIHRRNPLGEEIGEVGFSTMGVKVTHFLWIYIRLKDLENIISKYNLKENKF